MKKNLFLLFLTVIVISAAALLYFFYTKNSRENDILKKMISRLEATSRIAEVLVTDVRHDDQTDKDLTTIKFLEYDSRNRPLWPRYFTFSGNIIQFQSLVIRFDDVLIKEADPFRGRSAYLFWKVFMLDGDQTEEFDITKVDEIPEGYKVGAEENPFEAKLWRKFWNFALNTEYAKTKGIKNAQIEAPGTKFVPGVLYTIKIEHDGGIRIDVQNIPYILRGEKIPY